MLDDQKTEVEDDSADVVEVEDVDAEQVDAVNPDDKAEVDETEEDADDAPEAVEEAGLVVSLGGDDDDDADDASPVIKVIREQNKEAKKRIKELEAQIAEGKVVDKAPELGPRPTLEALDYDEDKYADALLTWNEKKREVDASKQAEADQVKAANTRYSERFQNYTTAKAALGAKDFDDAEDAVREGLDVINQSVIVANAEKPELLIYALGKNPDILAKLKAMPDSHARSFELGKLEAKMKVTGTSKPAPEKRVKGGAVPKVGGSKKLDQLREEAARTGDYSKVTAFKKQLAAQS